MLLLSPKSKQQIWKNTELSHCECGQLSGVKPRLLQLFHQEQSWIQLISTLGIKNRLIWRSAYAEHNPSLISDCFFLISVRRSGQLLQSVWGERLWQSRWINHNRLTTEPLRARRPAEQKFPPHFCLFTLTLQMFCVKLNASKLNKPWCNGGVRCTLMGGKRDDLTCRRHQFTIHLNSVDFN